MSLLDEQKVSRQMLLTKVDKLVQKGSKAIREDKDRILNTCIKDLRVLVTEFERLHVTIINRDKTSWSDPENMELYDHVETTSSTLYDLADDYFAATEEKQAADNMIKKYEEMQELGKEIIKELELLEESLSWISQSKDGEFRTDMAVVAAGIVQSDNKLTKLRVVENYLIQHEHCGQKRKETVENVADLNLKVKRLQIRLKSQVERSRGNSNRGSRAASPTRPPESRGQASVSAGEKEKPPDLSGIPKGFTSDESENEEDNATDTFGNFEGFGSSAIIAADVRAQAVTNRLINLQDIDCNGESDKGTQPRNNGGSVQFREEPGGSSHLESALRGQRSRVEPPRTNNIWLAPGNSTQGNFSGNIVTQPHSSSRGTTPLRSNSTYSGQSVFKPKKMEYPKFSGSIRGYNTFRRDFRMIIEEAGMFTEEQMSLLLRNECLQGAPKALVQNIYEYEEIWDKLNEVFDDEAQVVQMITKQIISFKEIGEDDMDTFIDFVDIIEKAHYDLQAYQSTNVLSNPVTIQTILEKCPSWAQQVLVREMTKAQVAREDEFKFIRKGLVELKKQARKLGKLNPKKHKQDGKRGGRGVVNAIDADPAPASGGAPPGGVVNAASGNFSKPSPNPSSGWKCYVADCTYRQKHLFKDCRAFKRLDVNGRGKIVRDKKLCVFCFSSLHNIANCERKTTWQPCDQAGCGKWHNRLIHGAVVSGLVLALPQVSVLSDSEEAEQVLLLIQQVPLLDGNQCVVFWDHGSTTALVTYKFANQNNLSGEDCSFELCSVGENKEVFNTKLYSVPLVDNAGLVHRINAFGIEKITSTSVNRSIESAVQQFEDVNLEDVRIEAEEVDLLIGMGNVSIMPTKVQVKNNLALFSSIFGSGKLLGGATRGGVVVSERVEQLAHIVAHSEARDIRMDFLSAESYGIDVPKRCANCKNCKECHHKNARLNFEDRMELECIEDNLSYDVANRKWTAAYSYKQDPSILKNNFQQAYACLQSTYRRLKKKGDLEAYNKAFFETVERGVFKEVSDEECKVYAGPVNYISIVEAYKPGIHSTTPIRLCMNSSLKFLGLSLNDIMMKGPSALNDILSVTLGFRSHQVAIVKDISKFYQSVQAVERDQHLRRVLHLAEDEKTIKIYKTTTVNFGDKIAGCVAQSALKATAKINKHVDEEAATKIEDDSYVDDTITGAENLAAAARLSVNMDKIAAMGGFIYKETVMSGDKSEEPQKVLGLGWEPEADVIFVGTSVNISAKKKGVKELPDIELAEIVEKFPAEITRRMVWRIVLGQYDLLGLISVFTIKLKLIMKRLAGEQGDVVGKAMWDKPVPKELRDEFLQTLEDLLRLKKVRFPRCVVPAGRDKQTKPNLMILADGSQSAFCALIYLRLKMEDGSFKCRLVAGKTRVAPSKKISVPRMELMGALTAVRLAQTVEEGLRLDLGDRWFFTDNSAVLGMIRRPSGSFTEFVGTRVGEIRSKCDAEKEWYWVPTDNNLADMGTRPTVSPEEMGPDSDYQIGQPWMRSPREAWPVTQTPGKVPDEELVPAAKVNHTKILHNFFSLEDFSSVSKAVIRLAWVAQAVQNIKLRQRGMPPGVEMRDKAEVFLLNRAQEDVKKAFKRGELDSLRPQLLNSEAFQEVQLVVTAGRLEDKMLIGYDKTSLPILKMTNRLAELYMKESHDKDHGGVDRTLQRSRNHVWIIQGRRLASKVVANCFFCKKRNKSLQNQVMAPLHENRIPPSPVFDVTAVDLFGPLKIRDSVKKRVSKDCWGVLFCCMTTSAIHLEVSEDYSTDSFLLCLRRFINNRGSPRKFVSDPGSQLMAAAAEAREWDCGRIEEWADNKKIIWHKIPTNSQHFNGCAEAMIKVTKRQLVDMLKGKLLTKGELDTVFSDVAQIVNSRPLMPRAGSDPTSGGPITPNHLLLGRATVEVPSMVVNIKASITKRMAFLETVKRDFWTKWFSQVFPHLIPSYKWKKEFRNMMEGDVVMMKKDSELASTYRMAVVRKAVVDPDGKVRRVFLTYRNVDGSAVTKPGGLKETERSVHNLIVIVPRDYKEEEISCDDNQMAVAGPPLRKC